MIFKFKKGKNEILDLKIIFFQQILSIKIEEEKIY